VFLEAQEEEEEEERPNRSSDNQWHIIHRPLKKWIGCLYHVKIVKKWRVLFCTTCVGNCDLCEARRLLPALGAC